MTAGIRTFLVLLFGVVVSLGQDTLSMHSAAATTTADTRERQQVSDHDVTASTSSEPASSSSVTSTTAAKKMPEKTLDSTSIKAVEKALLNALGLKSKPKPNKNIHIAPYMLELYNMHMQRHQRRPNRGQRPIPAGNTIRSFEPRDETETKDDRGDRPHAHVKVTEPHPQTTEDGEKVTLFFDVSSVSWEETLHAAELRLYHNQSADSGTNSSDAQPHKVRINIYEVMRPATRRRLQAHTRLLDTRVVDSTRSRWQTFDIRPAVLQWLREPSSNHGVEIHVHAIAAGSQGHVRLRRSTRMTSERWRAERPMLVTFSDDASAPRSHRTKRSARKGRGSGRRRKGKSQCRRQRLYVDFGDVGWNDWIVAPAGYKAYFCHGDCPFYLPDHLNSTNHAIVQTLVNSVDPRAVPRPCCVPTELSAISMLYLDEYQKVVLKEYRNMVVDSCGCR